MKVGMIGVGEMGFHMAGHLVDKGHDAVAYDVDAERLAAADMRGAKAVRGLAEMAKHAEVFIAIVRTDEQIESVTQELAKHAKPGTLMIAAGTHSLEVMKSLAALAKGHKLRFIDAPVVYGTRGAKEGTLLSLCGGEAEDVAFGKPAMLAYSRDVEHVGPIGAGQLAKTCNNLLHWIHCVGNYEALALAKQYGINAQRMREVLLKCPGENGTLRRWDTTRFTWQEKDMDFVMELAQNANLMLPLTGQVDQLVKKLTAADVKALLYGPEAQYLGQRVAPIAPDKGGLKF
jgi:3-hydroxyisobutyrate dehydrogenase-like beta-hydroxyacid dehydrogenase